MSFRGARLEDLAPLAWLRGIGDTIAATFGEEQDAAVQALKDAVSMRVVDFCPDDALHFLAQNFALPLFFGETLESLRGRIASAFDTWADAGIPQGIIRSLNAFGVFGVRVFNWSDWQTPDNWFSKFWVVVGPGLSWGQQTWGNWDWGDQTWGTTAPPAVVKSVLGQVRWWKSPQSLPVGVISDFGEGLIWGVHAWGEAGYGGLWGSSPIIWPMANLWGEAWVSWGAFRWGNGRWITGEM